LDSEKIFTTELRKILMCKEELLTDVKNLLYRRTDDVERLQKVIGDTEQQFADCLQQVKMLVDMVDPAEEGEADKQPLLERLRGAPERVIKLLTDAPAACVSHALAFVKSFWPEAPLGMFAQGVAAECTKEQFKKYLQEAQPVAEQIVQSVLQD
jgi:hypothetical protein